jgi:hypothetical protein
MRRRLVVAFVAAVAAISAAGHASALVGFSNAAGSLSSIDSVAVTVAPDRGIPGRGGIGGSVTCSLDSSSPSVVAFSIGDLVAIDCQNGALRQISGVDASAWGRGVPLAGFPARTPSVPNAGPNVTTTQCAAAWNRTASASERGAILALQPFAARVDHGSTTVQSANGAHATGPTCWITFILSGVRTAKVVGYWKHGSVPIWHGSVWTMFLPTDWAGFAVMPDGFIQRA